MSSIRQLLNALPGLMNDGNQTLHRNLMNLVFEAQGGVCALDAEPHNTTTEAFSLSSSFFGAPLCPEPIGLSRCSVDTDRRDPANF